MTEEKLLEELKGIFAKVFNDAQIDIDATTDADAIDAWDSLNHAVLIDAIEKHFNLKFDLMDMLNMQNVGAICQCILAKKSNV